MTKILNAENAQIITATVTVRALTIERRQVTLSVFRQLIEEPIVDLEVLRLRGRGLGACPLPHRGYPRPGDQPRVAEATLACISRGDPRRK